MQTPDTRTEQVQLWITVGQQPGVGGWFNVWLVTHFRRAKASKATAKKLPREACTA